MPSELRIYLFGGLHVALNGTPLTGFRSSKVPALLAYLVANRRPHLRDVLAALLWGELPDPDAKNNLRQSLSNLRTLLAPYLRVSREEVEFQALPSFFLDSEAFEQRLKAGDFAGAAALYQGEFLAGFRVRDAPDFEEWVLLQQVQWHEKAVRVLQQLTAHHAEQREYAQAMDAAHRLLALDPWQEEAHRQLMRLQARNRQYSASIAQYQACRAILRQEFDADPSYETTALYQQIRAAAHGPRHNLPAAVTGFVGREAELTQLCRLLAAPAVRLLTLLGAGGVGKTRLALEAATRCLPDFLNGVWFVSLPAAGHPERNQFILALAEGLGCTLVNAENPDRQLVTFLRAKELLLVVDNLEEWLEPAAWLAELLAQAPDVKILATSRLRLNLQAEQTFLVAGLPTQQTSLEARSLPAAGQLFLHRAQRLQAGFAPNPAERAAIARICELVEGLPLGIELAAAWAHTLPCTEIAAQLEKSLDFLRSTYRDASPRHASLRAVFDWSWGRLTAQQQAVFRRLAIFSGAFSHPAARHTAGADGHVLAMLVDHSLIWKRGDLLQLHEVSRHFGLEKLHEAGEEYNARHAHAHYYVQLLAAQEPRLQGREQPAALTVLDNEFENIRLAWQWLAEEKDVPALAAAIDGLYHFLTIRSRFLLALELFAAARQAVQPEITASPLARLTGYRLLAREGRFLAFLSRFEEANALLLQGLTHLRELDEADEIAFALGHLGGTARTQGNLTQAEAWLQECLALRQQTGNLAGQAVALLELGGVAFMEGEHEQAQQRCLDGLAVAQAIGDQQTTAHLLTGLSLICRELGHFDLALDYGKRGEAVYGELGDRYGVVQSCLTLGELNRQRGDWQEAQRYIEQAVQVSREIGHRSGEADGRHRLGQIAQDTGDLSGALEHQLAALELAAEIEERPLVLDALVELAHLLIECGVTTRALLILVWLRSHGSPASRRFQQLEARLAHSAPVAGESVGGEAQGLEQADLVRSLRTWLETEAEA